MKIKTSELTGAALDWAVAQCEMMRPDYRDSGLLVHRIGYGQPMPPYSTDWSQGGPIIERQHIGFYRNGKRTYSNDAMRYTANVICNQDAAPMLRVGFKANGPTPLIAAMRCYVASKLGDEVEIPEALV